MTLFWMKSFSASNAVETFFNYFFLNYLFLRHRISTILSAGVLFNKRKKYEAL